MPEQDKDKKPVTITVNGTQKTVEKGTLSFAEVVKLAFPTPPPGENIDYTVLYSRGPKDKSQGELDPSDDVEVVEGMRFDVTPTDRS